MSFTYKLTEKTGFSLNQHLNEIIKEQMYQCFLNPKNVSSLPSYMYHKLEVADATFLTYEAEKFDVVVVANVLHIMPDPDAALKEINRVLKKGGIIFASTFVYEKGYSKLLIWLMEKAGFKTYHKWSRMEYVKYVSQRGLKVIGDTLIKAHPLSECVLVAIKE